MQKGEVVFAIPRERGGGGKARKKPFVSKRFFQHASGTLKNVLELMLSMLNTLICHLSPKGCLRLGPFGNFWGGGLWIGVGDVYFS